LPLHITFPAIALTVLVITVTVSLRTPPTDPATLDKFYHQVRPFGWWGPVAGKTGLAPAARAEFLNDPMNVVLGIPWLAAMWLCPVYLVLHRFTEAGAAFALTVTLSVVLWYTWYCRLTEE
jgi:hypothetical protein